MLKQLILILLLANSLTGQQATFEKIYGSTNYEELWESAVLSNSTIIHAGYTNFGNPYFINTNMMGDTLWTRELVNGGMDLIYTVKETNDKAIIAAGRTSGFGAGALDINLVKINKNGNLLWVKAIGGTGDETANELVETFDKGFVIVGNTYSFGAGGNDFYIVKTDSLGNILWTKTIGSNLNDNAYSVFETSNKDIVVTGLTTENPGSGNNLDVMVARLDQNGNIKWVKKYGGLNDDRANSIIENNNKELIINGLYNISDLLLFKTDSMGTVLWSKSYDGGSMDWGRSIKLTQDDKIVMCGYQGVASYATDYLITKVDQLGNIIWAKNYGDANAQYLTNVEESFDKSFIITGYSQRAGSDYDYYIVRTDSNGKTNCTDRTPTLTVTALNLTAIPKTYTVSNGGVLNIGTQSLTSFCTTSIVCENVGSGTITSIQQSINSSRVLIFPNPNSGSFQIDIQGDLKNVSLVLRNILGQKVHEQAITKGANYISLSIEKGIYLFRLTDDENELSVGKLIIN
jgi:hypothetical protein